MSHMHRRVLGPTGRNLSLEGYVGFDGLPDQLVNIRSRYGFEFNVMCIGEPGIGKSTLIDTLFKTELETKPQMWRQEKVSLDVNQFDLEESGIELQLSVIDSRGFGDQINKEKSFNPIVEYIDKQLESYMKEESRTRRHLKTFKDTRVHVCLYFISPTGHSIKSMDLECLKELQSRVNVIPVIAKADTVTKEDLDRFRKRIRREFADNDIHLYQFPDEDPADAKLAVMQPFAVVGSRTQVGFGEKKVRARQYPWGLVEVENDKHCDFVHLRELLVRKHIVDLVQSTHQRHYMTYRAETMESKGFVDKDDENIAKAFEEKKKAFEEEMKLAEETMRQRFISKVQSKEALLKNKQQEMSDKYETQLNKLNAELRQLKQRQLQLDDQHNALKAAASHSPKEKRKSRKFLRGNTPTPQL